MKHEEFEALASVYALGALDGDDLSVFEAHLGTACERCAAALRESEEALTRVAVEAPPVMPPRALRDGLLRRAGRAATAWRWLVRAAGTIAAVVVGAALTGTYVAARYEAQLGLMARDTAAAHERLTADEAALRRNADADRATADLLRDPATRVVDLRGAGAAYARAVWNDRDGGRLFVANLPPAPAGKAYEAWTLAAGGVAPAGTFAVDTSGSASHRVEPRRDAGPVRAFLVTLEAEGGASSPTGTAVLASK